MFRILFSLFQEELSGMFLFELMMKNRDLNFITNYNLMSNGLIRYYEVNPLTTKPAIYLYFWYFIFYPFYVIPLEFSLYLWDLLRFLSTIYIAINIRKLNPDRRDHLFFFLFSGVGYCFDMYLNNTNWLIQLLLIESYLQWVKNNKKLSGILFTFCTFKVTLCIFPLILVLIKKIKVKDTLYYLVPFLLINVPYLIFPEYLSIMLSNWLQSETMTSDLSIITFFLLIWRFIQPAHLMYLSVIILIFTGNMKNERKKKRISSILFIIVFTFWIIIWMILLEFAFISG